MAIPAVKFIAALFDCNRSRRMSGSLDLSKTKLQGFASGVSGKSGNQSGSGISQLSVTVSNRTSHTFGTVSRKLNLVDRGIDLSTLPDAETKSVFVFVCAECGFLWNRIVRIIWVYDMRGD